MINKEYLKGLNPCADRWENYLKHYSDFSGSVVEFLELDKISFEDKKWVLFRDNSLVSEKIMREFALLCACRAVDAANIKELSEYFNLVLLMYESGENLKDSPEYDAARDAAWSAAWYVAGYVAGYAAWYAARDVTRYVAGDATRYAAKYVAWGAEEKIQLEMLINLVEENTR